MTYLSRGTTDGVGGESNKTSETLSTSKAMAYLLIAPSHLVLVLSPPLLELQLQSC